MKRRLLDVFNASRLASSLVLLFLCSTFAAATPRYGSRNPSDAALLAPFRKLPNTFGSTSSTLPNLAEIPTYSSAALPSQSVSALVYPVMGPRKSSDYGMRLHPKLKTKRHHHGIDLAAPEGAPVRAISSGIVIFADPWGGYGNLVVLKHLDGTTTSHYGHCKTLKVKPGQRVVAGMVIATVGSTGISTGPHLHFEVRIGGKPDNPEKFRPGLAEESSG
jgi:murein DD-endopeptidase MepM/ murein hydrolase activator NlpD